MSCSSILRAIRGFFVIMMPPFPSSTLFPYTTLFRSPPLPVLLPPGRQEHRPGILLLFPPCLPEALPLFPPCLPETLPLRSEEHTSELQSRPHLVCRLLLEKKKLNIAWNSCGVVARLF